MGYAQAEPEKRRGSRWLLVLSVAALVAVGGVAAFLLLRNTSPISFPDSIDGISKQTSPIAQGVVEGMDKAATVAGHTPKSAIYGSETAPAFVILVYDFPTPGDVDSFFTGGAAGFERSSGASVDLASKQVQSRGSTQYECAPFSLSTRSGDLCVWLDSATSAVVVDFSQPGTPIDTVATIHDAVIS